jgi:hypothetical protein
MKQALLLFVLISFSPLVADQRMVLWSFKIEGRVLEVPVELETDYGYMVLNVGSIEEPKPHYILGDRTKGVIRHFETKNAFLEALRQLDAGGELVHYTRCLVPSSLGLKEVDQPYAEIETICKERKIRLSEKMHMRCLCPDVDDAKR